MSTNQLQSDPMASSAVAAGPTVRPADSGVAIGQASEVVSAPLYVDLDGTLVATDTLWESLVIFVRRFPFQIPMLLLALLRGKAAFKSFVASYVTTDAALLPYRPELLEFLHAQRDAGRPLVLVTAADRRIADPVAAHLNVFEDVIATDGLVNLSGLNKLQAIREHSCDAEFDYVGDAAADLPIFAAARHALLVSPARKVEAAARAEGRVAQVFGQGRHSVSASILAALRPHQWAKNVLVAVPLLTSHLVFDIASVVDTVIAFVAFCLVASGQYVLNDLFDLEADRRHERKRLRPFASGELSVAAGLVLATGLVSGGTLLAAATLPGDAVFWLCTYFLISLAYSLELKQHFVLDVLILAGLFTIRVFAGGAAIDVIVSQWLLAFSLFLFMSLAFLKRYVEARGMDEDETAEMARRGYRRDDAVCLLIAGVANGYLAILVFALYANSERVQALYSDPRLIWLGCPLLAYWVTRIWFLAHRDEVPHDPVLFALTDRTSYFVGALLLAAVALAV